MFPLAKVEESEFQQRVQSLESWTTTTFPKLESEANHHEFYESTELSGGFLLLFLYFHMIFHDFSCFSHVFCHEFPMSFQVQRQVSELRSAVESGRSKKLGAPIGDILWL
jgi:hypothetical protein